jgi:poly(3-hydroxybutyrate) depolymerase
MFKKHMWWTIIWICLACAASGCQEHWPTEEVSEACEPGGITPGELGLRLNIDGVTRQAVIWVPEGPGPHDVVVSFHEFRSNPRQQAWYSGWAPAYERENVYLVAPDGKYATWNGGECCGKAQEKDVDDVVFLDTLIRHIDKIGCTSGRVLATGIGNGAMMAERWACESDIPDGVVSVGGVLQQETCGETRPIPMLHYHGEEDHYYPGDGSGGHRSVDEAYRLWSHRNKVANEIEIHAGDLSCRLGGGGQAPVATCLVEGMADLWPGAKGARVSSTHPLANGTMGGWGWIQSAWNSAGEKAEASDQPRQAVLP